MHAKSALMSVKDVLPEILSKSILIVILHNTLQEQKVFGQEKGLEKCFKIG